MISRTCGDISRRDLWIKLKEANGELSKVGQPYSIPAIRVLIEQMKTEWKSRAPSTVSAITKKIKEALKRAGCATNMWIEVCGHAEKEERDADDGTPLPDNYVTELRHSIESKKEELMRVAASIVNDATHQQVKRHVKELKKELYCCTFDLAKYTSTLTPVGSSMWAILDDKSERATTAVFHMMFLGNGPKFYKFILCKGLAKLQLESELHSLMSTVVYKFIYGNAGHTPNGRSQLPSWMQIRPWWSRNNWNGSDWKRMILTTELLLIPVLDQLKQRVGGESTKGKLIEELKEGASMLLVVVGLVMSHQITPRVVYQTKERSWAFAQKMVELEGRLNLLSERKKKASGEGRSTSSLKMPELKTRLRRHRLTQFDAGNNDNLTNPIRKVKLDAFYLLNPLKKGLDDQLQIAAESNTTGNTTGNATPEGGGGGQKSGGAEEMEHGEEMEHANGGGGANKKKNKKSKNKSKSKNNSWEIWSNKCNFWKMAWKQQQQRLVLMLRRVPVPTTTKVNLLVPAHPICQVFYGSGTK